MGKAKILFIVGHVETTSYFQTNVAEYKGRTLREKKAGCTGE